MENIKLTLAIKNIESIIEKLELIRDTFEELKDDLHTLDISVE